MKNLFLSTTNACPAGVIIEDLNGRRLYPLPINNMDLLDSFETEKIKFSDSLQQLLDDGWVILVSDTGQVITNLRSQINTGGSNGGTTNIQFSFASSAGRPLIGRTKHWAMVARFIFGGVHKIGQPTKVYSISWGNRKNKPYDIRLVRAIDGGVLTEVLGKNNTSPEILTFPNPAAFPAQQEILEIQMRTPQAGKYKLASMEIAF